MSGDGAGEHPNPGKVAPGSWASVSLCSAWRGQEGKVGPERHLGVTLLFLFFPTSRWPSPSSVILTLQGLELSDQVTLLCSEGHSTSPASDHMDSGWYSSNSSQFCLLSLQ